MKPAKNHITYSSIAEVRQKAEQTALKDVEFLRPGGTRASKVQAVERTRFTFIDGTELFVSRFEMKKPGFGNIAFKLKRVVGDE